MKPPKDLSGSALAKWRELLKPGMWGQIAVASDADVLAEYCRMHARKEKAEAMVAEHGELVASPNGFPVQSPWMQIVNKCRSDMLKIAMEFGGTPGSRQKLSGAAAAGKKAARKDAATASVGSGKFAPRPSPKLVVDNK